MQNKFIDIKLNKDNILEYVVRTLLFNSLKKNIHYFGGSLLDVGCGEMPYKQYILENSNVSVYHGIDLPSNDIRDTKIADYTWDGTKLPFDDATYDTILCTEVLEHCFEPDILLQEVYRVLKVGGVAYFTTPFVYPIHEAPFDSQRFTPFGLEYRFKKANFKNIKIYPLGGWETAMAQLLALWYTKRRFKIFKHRITIWLIMRCISFLCKKDKASENYGNNDLALGYSSIIQK